MFEFEFYAGVAGGVGLALIAWWVVDRQRAQNRPNEDPTARPKPAEPPKRSPL